MERESKYFSIEDHKVRCSLCPHRCILLQGQHGICRVRFARDKKLYVKNYGEISAIAVDPIEKKPLFHYKPGNNILSIGSYGCNFSCAFCQNYTIAHYNPETRYFSPEEMLEKGMEEKKHGSIGIAFTYNEPTIYFEYMLDTAKLFKENGLDVVVVTNGYINREPLLQLLPYVDAMNIDLKSFSEDFYKKQCSGKIEYVKDTIEIASQRTHVEIANLIISGYNDTVEETEELSKWIASIDKNIPLHISRYHPAYKFNAAATDEKKIDQLYDIARENLNYVYRGNVLGVDNNTYCPRCGNTIVSRGYMGASAVENRGESCEGCGRKLDIIF